MTLTITVMEADGSTREFESRASRSYHDCITYAGKVCQQGEFFPPKGEMESPAKWDFYPPHRILLVTLR